MPDHEFDGKPLTQRKIKITGAGDGLSEALKLEDVDLVADQSVVVLLRGKVEGATFKRDKDDDGYIRIDNIVAKSAKIVGPEANIEQILEDHEQQIAELRRREDEAKKGLKRIPFDDDADATQAAEDGLTPDDAVTGDGSGEASPPIEEGVRHEADLNLPDSLPDYPEGSPRNPHGLRSVGDA